MKIIHFLQLINIYNRDKKIPSLFHENAKKSLRITKSLKLYSFLNKYFASNCESYDCNLVHWVYYFFMYKYIY